MLSSLRCTLLILLVFIASIASGFVLQDLPLERFERSSKNEAGMLERNIRTLMFRPVPNFVSRFSGTELFDQTHFVTMSYTLLIFLAFLAQFVDSGSVGLCRTECIEKNTAKIVRVHLKDEMVKVGVCTNSTKPGVVSIVTPYICNMNLGLWTFDETDEEGIANFEVFCPTPVQYPVYLQLTCPYSVPQNFQQLDDNPFTLNFGEFSGDEPLSFGF
ncbi:unnamed protein product [Caenorhabditis bovis]|uniref:Uncharacterized protein n=1 Tax=Caenorhabditis bovis TaxID=2654633 RepID=A0A8S1EY44_9PELO|nr:unnamed protein product [Caenorhabditis bovis]